MPKMTDEGGEPWTLDLLNEVTDEYCVKKATGFRVIAVREGSGLQFYVAILDRRLEGMMAITSAFCSRRTAPAG